MHYIIQTNIYAIIIVIIILVSLYYQSETNHRTHRHFFSLLYLIIALLASDMLSELSNGQSGLFFMVLHRLSTFVLFSLSGFIGFFWILYTFEHIKLKQYIPNKQIVIYVFPAVLIIVLSFISLFTEVIFYIGTNNIYQRGSFFLLHPIILYGYIIWVIGILIRYSKHISKNDLVPLIMLPLLPAIGGVIQILHYGLLIIWPLAVLSMLVVYIFIQSKIIGVDAQTKLLNRRAFSIKVRDINRQRTIKGMLGGIIIDIDGFKEINDSYGHHVGDRVLEIVGNVLQGVFHPTKTLYRIGGDEFFVLLSIENQKELENKVTTLLEEIKKNTTFNFKIDLSIGYAVYNPATHPDFEKYIVYLDQLMYEHKRTKT